MEFLCKLFGLEPFYIHHEKRRFSPLISAWSIGLVSASVAVCGWALGDDIKFRTNTMKMQTTTAMVVTICDNGTLALASLTCVIAAAFRNKLTASIYCKLADVKVKLNIVTRRSKLRNERIHLNPTLTIVLIYVFFTIFLIIDFVLVIVIKQEGYMYIPAYIFHYTTFTAQLQLAVLARNIKTLFKSLNVKLSTYLSRAIVKPYTLSNTLPPLEIRQGTKVHWLCELSDIHWHLCSTIQEVNIAFGIQLVTLLLSIFAHIIITPYFFFLALTDQDTYGKGPYLYLKLAWMLLYSGQLCLIVAPCAAATDQAAETATVLSKYLNTELTRDVEKQTEFFLLQLLHHDANFSAFGLFNINLPVITSVAGAVTTYLVILIQFQKSSTDELD